MKKFLKGLLLLWVLLLWTSIGWCAEGYWNTATHDSVTADSQIRVITLSFVANTATAAIPTYTFTSSDKGFVEGMFLYAVEADPGSTGPTNGAWDINVNDAGGLNVLGGAADDLSATVTKMVIPKIDGTNYGSVPVDGTAMTVTIDDNAVNSAAATIKLYFSVQP